MDIDALKEALRSMQRITYVQTVDTVWWLMALDRFKPTTHGWMIQIFTPDRSPGQTSGKDPWRPLPDKVTADFLEARFKDFFGEVTEQHFVEGVNNIIEVGGRLHIHLFPTIGPSLTDRGLDRLKAFSFQGEIGEATAPPTPYSMILMFGQDPLPAKALPFVHVIRDRGPNQADLEQHLRRSFEAIRPPQIVKDAVEAVAKMSVGHSIAQVYQALGLAAVQVKAKPPLTGGVDRWTSFSDLYSVALRRSPPAYGQSS